MNERDEYGLKQGYWEEDDGIWYLSKGYYKNDYKDGIWVLYQNDFLSIKESWLIKGNGLGTTILYSTHYYDNQIKYIKHVDFFTSFASHIEETF